MDAEQINTMIVNLQVRLLNKLFNKIDGHYINDCVEDFTDEQNGFERGLRTCHKELQDILKEVQRPNPIDQRAASAPPESSCSTAEKLNHGDIK